MTAKELQQTASPALRDYLARFPPDQDLTRKTILADIRKEDHPLSETEKILLLLFEHHRRIK